jgi:hypothetical protein
MNSSDLAPESEAAQTEILHPADVRAFKQVIKSTEEAYYTSLYLMFNGGTAEYFLDTWKASPKRRRFLAQIEKAVDHANAAQDFVRFGERTVHRIVRRARSEFRVLAALQNPKECELVPARILNFGFNELTQKRFLVVEKEDKSDYVLVDGVDHWIPVYEEAGGWARSASSDWKIFWLLWRSAED